MSNTEATITENRANEIASELLADFGTKRPVVSDGALNDGNWSEPADLSTEIAFRAQCLAYRASFADALSCSSCGSYPPTDDSDLCPGCAHAIEAHGATRADAHMVECRGC